MRDEMGTELETEIVGHSNKPTPMPVPTHVTCGCIQVPPNGLKEKAAKTGHRWDPVSKRLVPCK